MRVSSVFTPCLFAALMGLSSQSAATAGPVNWVVTDGAFSQGGTFSGSFTFDADAGAGGSLTNWSISVTGGGGFTAYTYNPGDSSWTDGGDCCGGFEVFQFTSDDSGAAKRYFFLPFDPALTDAGGTSDAIISPGNSSEVTGNFAEERDVSTGVATSVASGAPEPGTLSLLSLSILLAGFALWRRLGLTARR
jgi:hypothetical protein